MRVFWGCRGWVVTGLWIGVWEIDGRMLLRLIEDKDESFA